MSDFDISIEDQIAKLHDQAEHLRDVGRAFEPGSPLHKAYMAGATRRIKQAARLRAQAGDE